MFQLCWLDRQYGEFVGERNRMNLKNMKYYIKYIIYPPSEYIIQWIHLKSYQVLDWIRHKKLKKQFLIERWKKRQQLNKYCDFRNSEVFNLNQKALNFLYVFHYNKKLVKEIIFLSDSGLDQWLHNIEIK